MSNDAMRRLAAASLAVAGACALTPAVLSAQQTAIPPERYVIDAAHTSVAFAVRHLGLSKVRGSFSGVSGAVLWDDDRPERSSVTVVIDAVSLDTGNEQRDDDLRDNFFAVERFPRITFQSTALERSRDGANAGRYELHGLLGIRDSLRMVRFPVEMLGSRIDEISGEKRFAFEGSLSIDRMDFGVTKEDHPAEIRLVIGHQIEIDLQLEARVPGYRSAPFQSSDGRSIGAELDSALAVGGVSEARQRYEDIIASPEGFDTSSRELALLGFKRLEMGDTEGAVLGFELYALAQPSPTADEWLGHAFAAAGHAEDAVAAYERALAAETWRPSAIEMLRYLRGATGESTLPRP